MVLLKSERERERQREKKQAQWLFQKRGYEEFSL